jgi:hypothetical protein
MSGSDSSEIYEDDQGLVGLTEEDSSASTNPRSTGSTQRSYHMPNSNNADQLRFQVTIIIYLITTINIFK